MRESVLVGSVALLILFGAPLARAVYNIPVQVSEVVDIVQYVDATANPAAAFALGLRASRTMLRPLRQAHTKVLLDTAGLLGGRYHLVFRGMHVLLVCLLLGLFVVAARPREPADLAALAFGLSVLTGLHTFLGMTREAYPVNHFLLIAVYGLATLTVAQSRGGVLADGAAALLTALALFTLESGLLVALVAFCAYAGGMRGISRRGLLLVGAVTIAYFLVRLAYLGIEAPAFAERAIGFGLGALSSEEQLRRFGDQRWVLYGYTAISNLSSILFSQPRDGIWTIAGRWLDTSVPPWMVLQVAASAIATGMIFWCAAQRHPDGRRGCRTQFMAIGAIVLTANAVLGYGYAKDEIVSFAGVFYALAAYAAMRNVLARAGGTIGALAIVAAVLWSIRVASNHYILHEQAFHVRNDWSHMTLATGDGPRHPVVQRLNAEALRVETVTPSLVSPQIRAWLGER